MCKTRRDTQASGPKPRPSRRASSSESLDTIRSSKVTSIPTNSTTWSSTSMSTASLNSIASLRDSLRESYSLFSLDELSLATNNFLSHRLSSTSSNPSWRCSLRGQDVAVFRPTFRGDSTRLPARLAAACRAHHASFARLIGAALGGDDHIYLVYMYVHGASLADCLRNRRNPGYTPLSSWVSRMQVAADVAQGLEYVHHYSSAGSIHNRLKSSSIIITEPSLRARICHFAAAELTGELPTTTTEDMEEGQDRHNTRRLGSSYMRIEGTRGYMAPEVIAGRRASQKSDVFALGVVLLELISGEEPLQYKYNKDKGECVVLSLIETAKEMISSEDEELGDDERRGRMRRWVDRRLGDSFPVEAAERAMRVALKCVEVEAGARPDMVWVAGKVSRLLLESKAWEEKVRTPTDLSLSMAPR